MRSAMSSGLGRFALLCALPLLLFGCAVEPKVYPQRYFWPPLPERPRIEWLDAYASQNDFPKSGFQKFRERYLTGADEPVAFINPLDIRSDGKGRVYVTDPGLPGVYVYDFAEREIRFIPRRRDGMQLSRPLTLALDGDGNLYVADAKAEGVLVFNREEEFVRAIDTHHEVERISAVAVDRKRKRLLVTDTRGHKVCVYSLDGRFLFSFGRRGGGDGEFNFPVAVTVSSRGEIIVADTMNARVQFFDGDGRFLGKFGSRGDGPADFQLIKGVAVDSDDHIYVTDGQANRVKIFDRDGRWFMNLGGRYSVAESGKIVPGGFVLPQGIDIDQNDVVYVVDQMNARIQVFQYISDDFLKSHPIPGIAEVPAGSGK